MTAPDTTILASIDVTSLRLIATDVDGTLTDGGMYYTADGELMKRFDTRDAFGMNRLRKRGWELAIITAEDTPIMAARARKLKIDRVFLGVVDKVALVEDLLADLGLTWSQMVYIGDDLNDLPVLERVGLSACPADAAWQVRDSVDYVSSRLGGHGAVRDLCDLIEAALDAGQEA